MITSVKKGLVAAGLISVGANTIFGCADIVGASFDRGDPMCDLSSNTDPKETIELTVWSQNPDKAGAGAKNFFTTSDKESPGGLYVHQLAKYKLYAAPGGTERHLVYQCTTEDHHFLAPDPKEGCSCLGYAVQIKEGSDLNKDDYLDLLKITGSATDVTALLPAPALDACFRFGNNIKPSKGCVDSMLYGPK